MADDLQGRVDWRRCCRIAAVGGAVAFVLVLLAVVTSPAPPPGSTEGGYTTLYTPPRSGFEVLLNHADGQAYATLAQDPSLARPEAFRFTLEQMGIAPTTFLPFPDHARYGPYRIGQILRAAEETGATAILATEKDAVKLEGLLSLPIFRFAIEMRVEEPVFVAEVLSRLGKSPS